MEQPDKKNKGSVDKQSTFISEGGEMGAQIRAFDWSSTPLGTPETWHHSLHTLLSIMLNANQPMFIVWGREYIMFYNDCYAEVLAQKHPSALGRSFFKVWYERKEEFMPLFDRAYAGEPIYEEDMHQAMQQHGYTEEIYFSYSLTPVRDEHGKVDGIFCTCTEITPSGLREGSFQTKEEALCESEARFRSIVTQTVVGIVQSDLEGRFRYVNDGFCEIVGRTREELLNMRMNDITHPEDLPGITPLMENMYTTGESFTIEKRYVRPDGAIMWVMNSINPILDTKGQVVGATAASIDISERKRAEEALQKMAAALERHARTFDTLFSNIKDGIYILDLEGRYLYSNKANLQFLGRRNLGEILGKTLADLNVSPKVREEFRKAYEQTIQTRQSVSDFALYTNPNGEERYLEYILSPILSPDGQVEAIVGSTRDISEQKHRELNEGLLSDIDAEFMRLSSSEEIMQIAGDKIVQYLGVSNISFAEIDETAEYATVIYEKHRAYMPKVVGVHRLSDYMPEAYLNELRAGQTLAVTDVTTDPRTAPTADAYTSFQVRSQIHAPYLRDGRWKFLLTVQRHEPYHWRTDEIELVAELSVRIWQRLERTRAEDALRISEENYRALFNSIDEGFCILEMLFDESDRPYDCRFLEINPTFEKQTGLTQATGKTARELLPDLEQHWIDIYGKVALTGEPLRFVENSEVMGRCFDVYAFRLDGQGSRKVALLFNDITERKKAEEALRESEQRARLAIEIANIGTWRIDIAQDLVYMDSRMREIWGEPEGVETIPMPQAVDRVHPEDREWVMSAISDTMGAKSPSIDFMEYRIVWNDGSVRWVAARGQAQFEGEAEQPIALSGTVLDITERKQAEEALRESEVRLRRAIEIETVGIIFFRTDGSITDSNDAFLRMSGYSHDDFEKGLVRWDKMTPPEWMSRSLEALEELKSTGRTTPYEKEYIRKDGSRWWALFAASLLNKDEGVEYILDITERKQAEEALRESEERYRLINRATSDVIWDWNLQTGHIHWNEATVEQFGYTLEEFGTTLGDWYERVHPEYRDLIIEKIQRAMDEGVETWTAEYPFRKHNGSYATILDRGHIARDATGKAYRMVGSMLDLTERKKAEEALRQSQEHLQLIMESATGYAIFTLDMDRRITDWNTGAERLLGYSKEEIVGQSGDIIFIPEDRKSEPEKEAQEALAEGRVENERWHVRKDGSRFWGSGTTMLLGKGDNQLRGFLKIMVDDTERMQMEEVLRQAKEEAEQAAKAKEEFLAHMSHEIRTPLNAVVGLAGLLLQQKPQPEQLENLQALKFSAENLRVLVNDILDFSKIQAGKVVVEETDVDLSELLISLQKSHKSHALEQGNELQLYVDKQIPKAVRADQLKLSQILHNLVSNAVKFTHKGLVTVEVSLNRKEGERLWLDFSVSDTGIGIPEDKLSIIFDVFTQANISTVRQYGGTGLGLSITKLLLELMDSHIEVESQPGKGSRFFFTLLMKESMAADTLSVETTQPHEEQTDMSQLKLLLVEDVDINRMIITQFLQEWWQLKPDEAVNGQKALEMAQKQQYDMLLMDIRMPVMDGYQAAQAIRLLPGKNYEQVPIIALTADTTQEVEKHPEAALFTDVITKPFEPHDLRQKLIQYAPGKMGQLSLSSGKSVLTGDPTGMPATGMPATDMPTTAHPYQVDIMKLEAFFKGDTQSMKLFIDKAIDAFNNFQQRFATNMAERDEASLGNLIHKMNVLLDMLSLEDLKVLLQHCRSLLIEKTTQDQLQQTTAINTSLDEAQQQVEAIVDQVLVSLKKHSNRS